MAKPLIEYLRIVPDPRSGRKKKHDLGEILVCLIAGFLCGRTGLRRCLAWCVRHEKELKKGLKLKNGIASVSTVSKLLSRIDRDLFLYAFMEWAAQLVDTEGKHLAIDGKSLRAAASKVNGSRTPLLLNVIEVSTGVVVAQMEVDSKENEIVWLPELIGLLDLQDSMVTIDAIGTQTAIMQQIKDQGGHFLLTVKRNQPQSYEEIVRQFQMFDEELAKRRENPQYRFQYEELETKYDEYSSKEKNRDRYEYRRCCICTEPAYVSKTRKEWPFIQTVGCMKQTRILITRDQNGNDTTPGLKQFVKTGSSRQAMPEEGDSEKAAAQVIGIISDMVMSAKEAAKCRRDHWAVENRLHHVLDDTFREDRSPAKGSKINLALIRKFAYNILRVFMVEQHITTPFTEVMDLFSDSPNLLGKYLFNGIASLC